MQVRVYREAESPEDAEIVTGVAYSPVIRAPMRLRIASRTLFIFSTNRFATSIFAALKEDGLVDGHPVQFDLARIDNDAQKTDVFNAWAAGTGNISSMAYFGHEVHREMHAERITSLKATFVDGTVANVNSKGRITIYGEAQDDDLVSLFDRLYTILGPD